MILNDIGTWRLRIRDALEQSGKSMREVSLAAQCGPGYLFDILESGKEPTVERLLRIANVLEISVSSLLYGIQMGKEEEELLELYSTLTPSQRRAFLNLARSTALPE